MNIRWMIRRDMETVLRIEQEGFPIPWTEEDFLQALRQRNVIGMVAEEGDTILGYMVYLLDLESINLLNLAVAKKEQRKGVGRRMIEKLQDKASHGSRRSIAMCIREANLAAQLFSRSMGFTATKVLRRFYDNDEAAYRFEFTSKCRAIPDGTTPQNRVSAYINEP